MIRNIIWDWNGTLLNDAHDCVEIMNGLLEKRGLPLLEIGDYREVFTFPVQNYYEAIGFDFSNEPFEIPAMEFMDGYFNKLESLDLHLNVQYLLDLLRSKQLKQILVSAMENGLLKKMVTQRDLDQYFTGHIYGITDHYGRSKLQLMQNVVASLNLPSEETIIVGDTLHDAEIAKNLGIGCILLSHGHQSVERLKHSGFPVLDDLQDITKKLIHR